MDKPGQAGDMMDNRERLPTCPQLAPTCPQRPAYGLSRFACQTAIFFQFMNTRKPGNSKGMIYGEGVEIRESCPLPM